MKKNSNWQVVPHALLSWLVLQSTQPHTHTHTRSHTGGGNHWGGRDCWVHVKNVITDRKWRISKFGLTWFFGPLCAFPRWLICSSQFWSLSRFVRDSWTIVNSYFEMANLWAASLFPSLNRIEYLRRAEPVSLRGVGLSFTLELPVVRGAEQDTSGRNGLPPQGVWALP